MLYQNRKRVPLSWLELLKSNKLDEKKVQKNYVLLLLSAYLLQDQSVLSAMQKTRILEITKNYIQAKKKDRKSTMKNIDNTPVDAHNAHINYENNKELTETSDYVIQPYTAFERLKSERKNAIVGEVILLSTTIFREEHIKKENLAFFHEVFHSLNAVGLVNKAKGLAFEAALATIEKKEH